MKTCKHCKRELPLERFIKNYKATDGHTSVCLDCYKAKRQLPKVVKRVAKKGEEIKKVKKNFRYSCVFDTPSCAKSTIYGRCCHECPERLKCKDACLNTPEKCGAIKYEI